MRENLTSANTYHKIIQLLGITFSVIRSMKHTSMHNDILLL